MSDANDAAGRKARELQPLGAALCLLSAMTMIAVLAWVIASVSERSASTLTDADRVEAFRPAAVTGAD